MSVFLIRMVILRRQFLNWFNFVLLNVLFVSCMCCETIVSIFLIRVLLPSLDISDGLWRFLPLLLLWINPPPPPLVAKQFAPNILTFPCSKIPFLSKSYYKFWSTGNFFLPSHILDYKTMLFTPKHCVWWHECKY